MERTVMMLFMTERTVMMLVYDGENYDDAGL